MGEPKTGIKAADKRMRAMADPVGLFLTDVLPPAGVVRDRRGDGLGGRRGLLRHGPEGLAPRSRTCCSCSSISKSARWSASISAPTTCRSASCSMSASRRVTRHLIGFVQEQPRRPTSACLSSPGSTLILAFAVLVIRFTSNRYPSPHLRRSRGGERPSRGCDWGRAGWPFDLICPQRHAP